MEMQTVYFSFPTELDIMTGSTNSTSLGRSYLLVQPMTKGESVFAVLFGVADVTCSIANEADRH